MLLHFVFLYLSVHLGIVIGNGSSEIKKIQEEYYKSNPKFPDSPLNTPEPTSKEAYAYMYCSRPNVDKNFFYLDALQLAIYRLQTINDYYDPISRDIIVMACSYTPEWQIDQIKALGVIVVTVDPIIPTGRLTTQLSYIDQYTKIHLWRLIKWERLLYLDIDTTVAKDFFSIWDESAAQIRTKPKDPENAKYYPYLFAAVEDLEQRKHHLTDTYFNAGIFMIKPSMFHYKYLLSRMNNDDSNRFFMEQDYFNLIYGRDGPIPASRLPMMYNRFVEFREENEPGTKIRHCKFWWRDYNYIHKYAKAWKDDLGHLVKGQPLDLDRLYYLDDIFAVNPVNKEAYVFLLTAKQNEEKNFFILFQTLKMSIAQIREYQKEVKIARDIIVLAIDGIPGWYLQQLQSLGVFVFKVNKENNGKASESEDYLKMFLWKLVQWDRILYIDSYTFINNKSFIKIWDEQSTQIHTKPVQSYKQPLHNVPVEKVNRFYPYLFSAVSDSTNDYFNSNIFMLKPSIPHYDYLVSLFSEDTYEGNPDLLNFAYNKDSPIPSSTLDQSYNTPSTNKDSSLDDIKSINGKLWTPLDEKDVTPFVTKFWSTFNTFNTGRGENDLPADCEAGTSPTRCKTCANDYNYVDYNDASYMLCPQGVPFGKTLDWFEFGDQCKSISKGCVSCIQDGECSSCETGFFSKYSCYIYQTKQSDIVGYCNVKSQENVSYIAKGSICSPRLTPTRITRRIAMSVMFLVILATIFLFARFCLRKIARRLGKKNYDKMDDSIDNTSREEVTSPSTANKFKVKIDI